MRIWPAIDIKDGKCVRLSQGDLKRETVYGSSPADMAIRWVAEGATGLHIIDLDGAVGRPPNFNAIAAIADEVDVDIQVGGGIRDEKTIEDYLAMGIKRLIISTQSVLDLAWTVKMAQRYQGHLLISIDTRDDMVAFDGWQNSHPVSAIEHARSLRDLPLAGLIYTNIDRAGMMSGPDIRTLEHIIEDCSLPITASGGIQALDDLRQLSQMNLEGCVIGKALYAGHLTLPDAIAMCNPTNSAI
jgi:phosphoribosylformimino-5-aminoimidazole carboxamide ribotide isomerase